MNTDNICISGAEIQEVKWKIGSNPWASNFIQPFTAGDTATAILKVTLDDCSEFEGKTLEAFVQVPNDAKDIVKIFALIDANNQALFTLPTELLWWPGDYNVNFMFADGDKVNYSNVLNAAYTVNENPALAGQNPPTILPGDKADYEDLISRLSAQTAKGDIQIPKLETENTRAEGNISTITGKNTEAEQKISDLTGKIVEGNEAQVKWQDTIDNGESKIGELDVKIGETDQKIIEADLKIDDVDKRIIQAEQEISDMETRAEEGIKKIEDAVNAIPDEIQKIEDKTSEGLTSLTDQESLSVQNIINQETTSTQNVNNQGLTSVQAIKDQEATSKQVLTQEGVSQRGLISTAGNTEVLKVTNEGHTQKNSITTEGDNQKGLIAAEGAKQTGLVKTQGDTSLAAVQKVQTDVEAIIQGDPAGGNAIALGGKTRAEFDDDISNVFYSSLNTNFSFSSFKNIVITGDSISYNRYSYDNNNRSNAFDCFPGMKSWSFQLRDALYTAGDFQSVDEMKDFIVPIVEENEVAPVFNQDEYGEYVIALSSKYIKITGDKYKNKFNLPKNFYQKQKIYLWFAKNPNGSVFDIFINNVKTNTVNSKGTGTNYNKFETFSVEVDLTNVNLKKTYFYLEFNNILNGDAGDKRIYFQGISSESDYNVNLTGSGGTTIEWLYNNRKNRILNFSPDLAIITTGNNDVTQPVETHKKYLELLIKDLILNNITPFIIGSSKGTSYISEKEELIKIQKEICNQYNVPYVTTFDLFRNVKNDLFLYDNVHLNKDGNDAFAKYMFNIIFRNLKINKTQFSSYLNFGINEYLNKLLQNLIERNNFEGNSRFSNVDGSIVYASGDAEKILDRLEIDGSELNLIFKKGRNDFYNRIGFIKIEQYGGVLKHCTFRIYNVTGEKARIIPLDFNGSSIPVTDFLKSGSDYGATISIGF